MNPLSPPSFRRPLQMHILAASLHCASAAAQPQWLQRTSGDPAPRYRHALAYDAARGVTVLFSGAPNPAGDTWEWNGTTWAQRLTATAPPGNTGHALAYDSRRANTVAYVRDAFLNPQTWTWDGSAWQQRFSAQVPSSRERLGMAHDAGRGVAVVFGGYALSEGPLADTWEWNGATWTRRTPAASPPARWLHSLAYDAARGVTVLFGGFGTTSELGDTWEYDGATWQQRTPVTRPSPRYQHQLAYDAARRVTVLFGGYSQGGTVHADTWEWDGVTWTQRVLPASPPPLYEYGLAFDAGRGRTVLQGGSSSNLIPVGTWEYDGQTWIERTSGPLPRGYHSMAFDSARARAVLFGGFHNSIYLDDTWEWDGNAWLARTPATRPSPRIDHGTAFDTARARVVLFGGQNDAGEVLGDTWEWNGTSWLARQSATRPTLRAKHALAYDERRGRTVLFGGAQNIFGGGFDDNWESTGTVWTQAAVATRPPARDNHALAYDRARGRVVLFGGEVCPLFQSCSLLGDTWEWDGTHWQQLALAPALAPAARSHHVMTFDRNRDRVVLHGGRTALGLQDDVWEWDGANWRMRGAGVGPLPRSDHALVFDTSRGRAVMFGGNDTANHPSSETWEFFAPCDPIGVGHATGSLSIACTAVPKVGATFCLSFANPVGVGATVLLLGSGPCAGMPAAVPPPLVCSTAFFWVAPLAVLAGGEPGLYCFAVPTAASLAGANLCVQGASLETTCVRATDGMSVTVQPQ